MKHVLIIDDVMTNLKVISEILKDNYQISTAKSGKIALLMLKEITPDIILLDIKFSDTEKYENYIGIPLETVLRFLAYADKQKKRVIVRQVITPGVNDAETDFVQLQNIVGRFPCIEKVELLPFLKLCTEKYEALQIPFPFGKYPAADAKKVENLQTKFFTERFTNG